MSADTVDSMSTSLPADLMQATTSPRTVRRVRKAGTGTGGGTALLEREAVTNPKRRWLV